MTITDGYLTLDEAKSYLGISDTDDDVSIELAVEAASRAIDDWCGRRFYTATETRYYTSDSGTVLDVDEFTSITTLKTDGDGDGTFGTVWASSDYVLEPFNAAADGRPYTRITKATNGNYSFPSTRRGVEIAGSFGWPSVPDAVKQACAIQTGVIFKRATEGAAPIVNLTDGTTLHSSRFLDRTVELLIRPYRRMAIH